MPLFGFFNDWYISQKNLPGVIYGISWYLYMVICLGQCNIVFNRFMILKNPTSNASILNVKKTIYLIIFQTLLPSFMIFLPIKYNLRSYYVNNNITLVVEVENQNISNFFLTIGSVSGVLICFFSIIIGVWNIILFKKLKDKNRFYEKSIKKEKPLLLNVCLQTLNFIALTTAEILQFFAGKYKLDEWYAVTLYLYPLCEDMLCLLNPIILYFTCKSVRRKFSEFWFGKLFNRFKRNKPSAITFSKNN